MLQQKAPAGSFKVLFVTDAAQNVPDGLLPAPWEVKKCGWLGLSWKASRRNPPQMCATILVLIVCSGIKSLPCTFVLYC